MPFEVANVKLPERTRARFNTESNQQRVQKPHDIRGAIPLVDYTNPAKFPPYIFREYPKMPLLDHNKPIIIDESGGVLVFYDAADEVEFKDMNPEIAEEIERNTPAKALADTIAAKDQEIEDLRTRLRNAGLVEEAPRKKPGNALAAATQRQAPTTVEAAPSTPKGEEETSLREMAGGGASLGKAASGAASDKKNKGGNPLKKN